MDKKLQDAGREAEAVVGTTVSEEVSGSNNQIDVKDVSSLEGTSISQSKDKKEEKNKKPEVKKQKFFKRHKKLKKFLVILLIIAILIVVFVIYSSIKAKNEAIKNAPKTEYTNVEKRDLNSIISTTGVLESTDKRTVTSKVKDARIETVNFKEGDMVNEGDVILTFSVDDINKKISDTQEDISISKQKEALEAKSRDNDYVYSYGTQSLNMADAAEKVQHALEELHEACDAYGDAKRELEEFDGESTDGKSEEEKKKIEEENEQKKQQYENAVASAYEKQVQAQRSYDSAVEAQAKASRDAANSLSKSDIDYAKNSLSANESTKKLQRELETYQENLDDYIVYAPISGIVTSVDVEAGNGYSSGNIMTIQAYDSYKVTTQISEYDIPEVKEGQKVIIKTDATRDEELEGVVSFVAPTTSSSSTTSASSGGMQASASSSEKTFEVEIDLLSHNDRLRIGMSASVNIITEEHSGILAVRYDAIGENENGEKVVYVEDNTLGTPTDFKKADKDGKSETDNEIEVIGVDGVPTGANNKPDSGDRPDSGDMPGGGPRGRKSGGFGGLFGSDQVMPTAVKTREIVVETGIEGDYYTEIKSDEITEGMQLVVPAKEETNTDFFGMMGGPGGGPGGPM